MINAPIHANSRASRWLRVTTILWLAIAGSIAAGAQVPGQPFSQRMANATIERWPKGRFSGPEKPWQWNYELGTLLEGMDAGWYDTADGRYYRYIKDAIDPFITPEGAISTYEQQEYTLDNVLAGRQLLLLYGVTRDKRYYQAATELRHQLESQPRNASGGFWHKKIYPNQMWLDGLYMAEPFLAEYASVFHEPQDFAEITRQFVLMEQHTRDAKTGLMYHGWDEVEAAELGEPRNGNLGEFLGARAWAGT